MDYSPTGFYNTFCPKSAMLFPNNQKRVYCSNCPRFYTRTLCALVSIQVECDLYSNRLYYLKSFSRCFFSQLKWFHHYTIFNTCVRSCRLFQLFVLSSSVIFLTVLCISVTLNSGHNKNKILPPFLISSNRISVCF